ncbi:phosphoadenylylsulfate reductase (thioredoxin) [Prochlorococcus marinus str. MIT 9312]|uniref:Phosphoadenosine 5'-phosphosulfate reductase n=1 Tax=Prochlorococcus marinus (strain MIT 9312) TaxID=74546 RepID=Q31DA0_PROM9|nr:phosphoadenylyl-sulfate reductase [Prochlorococcus marinus]ABB49145.1 phosphoadenylylsulfate reductase (thioredoxin) [Prochlorococcus marinus str. MIT 9312]KGF99617.1 Phosphoadenylyl-sulfate reductase (thioredoxin) [Prochlorococcus marinus str. MIT 9311]
MIENIQKDIQPELINKYNQELRDMTAQEMLTWGYKEFDNQFAITTSFGIQSSVLLNMVSKLCLQKKIKIFWIDTGYLPPETYHYAEKLIVDLSLEIEVLQSELSPARMETIHGKLWETNKASDLDKYHDLRKIKPLENGLEKYKINCWASGVRSSQTENRKEMKFLDLIRQRLSLRPLLNWTNKDIFYYMKENNLPAHPLFSKGYSTVGDWHSSTPDGNKTKGRATRFGGIKQECGIHTNN